MHPADVIVSVAPSPAFWVAVVLYSIASLLFFSSFIRTPDWIGKLAWLSLLAAFLAHGTDIGYRGVAGVHPGTSVREAVGFLGWVVSGGYLLWRGQKLSVVGAFVAPIATIMLIAARLSPSGDALPGLSLLGRVHISLATVGVAIFTLATSVAVVYLLQERNLKRKRFDGFLFKRGVALETLDSLAHRLVVIGFPIFTVSMMLGVVWVSQRATGFGRPEYPIALVTWSCFGGLLVARSTRGWRGRRAALLTIAGFSAALVVLVIYFARRSFL